MGVSRTNLLLLSNQSLKLGTHQQDILLSQCKLGLKPKFVAIEPCFSVFRNLFDVMQSVPSTQAILNNSDTACAGSETWAAGDR